MRLPDPLPVQSWLAGDGSLHQRKSEAALQDISAAIAAAYLAHRPGQIGAAEQFANSAIKLADRLLPLLLQVAAATAL